MKTLTMYRKWMGSTKPADEKTFVRASRWITVHWNYNPSPRNELWDYVTDENGYHPYDEKFNPENGLELIYFTWNGRKYAIEQFYRLGSMFVPELYYYYDNGESYPLCGVDMD